ncbi:UDP-N-acetylmuramoyl-tripeptide--D-alanyl-D-alanine ligase, partial [Enterococcus faecium]
AEVTATGKAQTDILVQGEPFTIPLPGSFNVTNALIGYTIGRFFGVSIPEIGDGLAHVSITHNRNECLTAGNGGAILSDV